MFYIIHSNIIFLSLSIIFCFEKIYFFAIFCVRSEGAGGDWLEPAVLFAMDLENKLWFKLKEHFNEKLKLLYINRFITIILTKEDKVHQFERDVDTLLKLNKNDNSFIESKILNELCFKRIIDFNSSEIR